MINPENAQEGDLVWLKGPLKVIGQRRFDYESLCLETPTGGKVFVDYDDVECVERPMKVGDRFILPDFGVEARVEAIVGHKAAWT
jgi:hypothetical protein